MTSFLSLTQASESSESNDDEDYENQLYSKIHHSEESYNENETLLETKTTSSKNDTLDFNYGERYKKKRKQVNNNIKNNINDISNKKKKKRKDLSRNPSVKRKGNANDDEIELIKEIISDNYGKNSKTKISSYLSNCEQFMKNKKIKFSPYVNESEKSIKKINNTNIEKEIEIIFENKSGKRKNNKNAIEENIILNVSKNEEKKKTKNKKKKLSNNKQKDHVKKFVFLGQETCSKDWTHEMRQFYRDSWNDENYDLETAKQNMRGSKNFWITDPIDYEVWRMNANPYNKKRCRNCFQLNHIEEYCPQPKRKICCIQCGKEGHTWKSCQNLMCRSCDKIVNSYESHKCERFARCAFCKGTHTKEFCQKYIQLTNTLNSQPPNAYFCPNCTGPHKYEQCDQFFHYPEAIPMKPRKRKKKPKKVCSIKI